jgi:hypothetical protein
MAEVAPSSVVEALSADATTHKRASWEAFEFTVLGNGDVEVVNGSHENPTEHAYTVHVECGVPSDCTCPAWEHQEGACKHMVAVAIREPVLKAASAESRMRADGGTTVEADQERERPYDELSDCSSSELQ